MLKQYSWNGSTWQFEEDEAPKDAVEFTETKKAEPLNKAAKPKNKAQGAK